MTPRSHSSVLKVWQAEVSGLTAELNRLNVGLKAVGRQRQLAVQLAVVRQVDGPGAHLGSAVLRCDRTIAGLEIQLQRKFRLLLGDLECARELLSPRILLEQARREWQVLQDGCDASIHDPDQLLRLHQKRESLLNRLLAVIGVLHPGVPIPGVCTWVEQRARELKLERSQLFVASGCGPDAF